MPSSKPGRRERTPAATGRRAGGPHRPARGAAPATRRRGRGDPRRAGVGRLADRRQPAAQLLVQQPDPDRDAEAGGPHGRRVRGLAGDGPPGPQGGEGHLDPGPGHPPSPHRRGRHPRRRRPGGHLPSTGPGHHRGRAGEGVGRRVPGGGGVRRVADRRGPDPHPTGPAAARGPRPTRAVGCPDRRDHRPRVHRRPVRHRGGDRRSQRAHRLQHPGGDRPRRRRRRPGRQDPGPRGRACAAAQPPGPRCRARRAGT